jgi:hypothetical protein
MNRKRSVVLTGDTHVHLCCDSGPAALDRLARFGDAELATIIERALGAHLASGVATVRDLGDRRGAVLDWRDRNRRGHGPAGGAGQRAADHQPARALLETWAARPPACERCGVRCGSGPSAARTSSRS